MSARTQSDWKAICNRYSQGDTVSWTVEAKRPDGSPVVVAGLSGDRHPEDHPGSMTPPAGEAAANAAAIAAVPLLLRAAELARIVLSKKRGEVEKSAVQAIDDALTAAAGRAP